MSFSQPAWLAAGAIACLALLGLWRRYDARQHAALARFVSAHLRSQLTLSVSIVRRRIHRTLLLAALALLFVALAGPLVGFRWEQVSRRGIEIVFAVDTSRSMSTPDVRPDRLTRAKLAIDDFTNRLEGDGVGLVAFAGDAYLVCPVTLDYAAFHESLSSIDVNTIGRGGTNIASAIREADAALRRRPSNDKILILVTDGEDLEGDALVAAQTASRQDGLKIYTVGVGTAQGDLIPLSANPNAGFVKDESGGFVKSRLDEPALKAIAAATGGQYAPLGPEGQGFESIYQRSLAPLLKHDLASRQQRVYIQRYQWPLSAALALLLLSMLVGTRANRVQRAVPLPDAKRSASPRRAADPAAASLLLLLLLPLWAASPARASTSSAQSAYEQGDYAAAAQEYAAAAQRDPKKPLLQFNAGAAAYRAGQFPQAAQAFQSAINHAISGDPRQLAEQQDAYYNLGNTLYRSGQKTAQSAPQQTLDTWAKAVKAYDTALELRADDADSKYNRDFVKRKINELKQQQNQQQNQPNKNQQNNQNNQNKQSNQNQPPQGQPPSGQQPPGQQPPGQQPPGQQPPGQQPPGQQPPGQPPPPSAGQPPPGQQPPGQQPPGQEPPVQPPPGQQPPGQQPPGQQPAGQPPAPSAGQPPPGQQDDQPVPGEMSREEARQLLDSQKGDERHALGVPVARRQPNAQPDKPIKDW